MIKNYIKYLLRAPWLVNDKFDSGLETLFLYLIANKNHITSATMDKNMYEATLGIGDLKVTFWIANKYYAYASNGVIERKGKITYKWHNCMPSRMTISKLSYLVEDLIPQETSKQKIDKLLAENGG